jgi:hypothetical protein
MNNLGELRDYAVARGYKIKEFNGYALHIGRDTYTMLAGEIYLNKVKTPTKEILKKFTEKSAAKKTAAKAKKK